jgi:YD repeat-containing protein
LTENIGDLPLTGMRLRVTYDTRIKVPRNDPKLYFGATASKSFGELWHSSFHRSLVFQNDSIGYHIGVQASRGDGSWISFGRYLVNGYYNYVADAGAADRLMPMSGGWRYIDASARSQEVYDEAGRLLSIAYADGSLLTYAYSDASTPVNVAPVAGLLLSVQDQFGHSVRFSYEQPSSAGSLHINQIVDPEGRSIGVTYDANNNLAQLRWPDGKSRQYLYERADLPWAVTGIIDENASRLATYGYDAEGRANDTQWAGGADHYAATYTTPPRWNIVETYDSTNNVIWRDHYWQVPQGTVITGPGGRVSALSASLVQGMPRLTAQSQPAGSGCAASSSFIAYDVNGNKASADDFNGSRACYANDLSRNLETTRVEGLANTASCADVTPANRFLPAGSRKTSTEWHPDWRLAAKLAEPGRITTSIYNGRPDPFASGAIASCAPTSAVLPDGKPIAVLCKTVEQATTDADGSLGFTAGLQSGVAGRVRSWTYNQYGQVLTEKDPLGNTTTYAYYADTTAEHTMGDLQTVTNAAGKVTRYTKYGKTGRVLEQIDPNGVTTLNTYDLRQRLLSTVVGGQQTGYTYDAVGQLTRMTQPDGSWVGYEYDAAHRQTAVSDNLGNRIEYVLDDAGNRKAERVKDANGSLKRVLSRNIDPLGRVQQQTAGRE